MPASDEPTRMEDLLCVCYHYGDCHSASYPGKCGIHDCDCERFEPVENQDQAEAK